MSRHRFVLAVPTFLLLVLAPLLAAPRRPPQDTTLPSPVELTDAQDHRRLLDLLGIKALRPGADPRNPNAPNPVNYDESKATTYTSLPDPLVLKDGRRVTDAATWWKTRRVAFAGRYIKADAPTAPVPDTRPEAAKPGQAPRVALTFDDLPVHAALPPGVTRVDIARSILAALKAHAVPPTYGFVNANGLSESDTNPEVLRLWRAAGQPLGNHTFSHMDLHANTADAFEQDIIADEATLRAHMGEGAWKWLRYPYLHEGETPEKQRAVAAFLEARGYRIARVTTSFDDYAYNDPYARCAAKDDHAAIDWMKERYLARADEALTASQDAANLAYGRDIPHVMLLHFGAFDAVMLPRLLDRLQQRGVVFVTLDEAQSDPAYAAIPAPSEGALVARLRAARGTAAPPGRGPETMKRLAGLCR